MPGACALHNTFLCYKTATQPTGAADHAVKRCWGDELSSPTALAACEPQALDGVAEGFFGGTMKCAVVKRRRHQSRTRSESQGRLFAAGALCVPLH